VPEYSVPIEKGVDISIDEGRIRVKGPRGELSRVLQHPHIAIERKGEEIVVSTVSEKRKDKAVIGTWSVIIKNMMIGVTRGYSCSMKLIYAHFPVKIEQQGEKLVIKNFLGERATRSARIEKGVEVKLSADVLDVTGTDKEKVGQTAANIEHATKIKGFDRRVFQDGIFLTRKTEPKEAG